MRYSDYQLLLISGMIGHVHFFGTQLLLHAFSYSSYKALKNLLIPLLNQGPICPYPIIFPDLGAVNSSIKYKIFCIYNQIFADTIIPL